MNSDIPQRHSGKNNWALLTMPALIIFMLYALSLLAKSNGSPMFTARPAHSPPAAEQRDLQESLAGLPIYFSPNVDRIDKKVKYYAAGAGYNFYLTQDGVTYSFTRQKAGSAAMPAVTAGDRRDFSTSKPAEGYAVKVKFSGANETVVMQGQNEQAAKVNYFTGSDPKAWKTDVSTFGQVTYRKLYVGIDLAYKGNQEKIKYEFNVAPQADYRQIQLTYTGADSLRVTKKGDLLINTPWGALKDEKPLAYQMIGAKKVPVAATFAVEKTTVSFQVGRYNPNHPLIIDPGLTYSTFVGGSGRDIGWHIAVDTAGSAYIAGYSNNAAFPTTAGAYDTGYNGGNDIFVTKLNPAGTALVYSTYLGGAGNDTGYGGIAVDDGGNVYLGGYGGSADFPTTGGSYDTSFSGGGYDLYAFKLNAAGNALLYSTFLGGTGNDEGYGNAIDDAGNLYVTGRTSSANFPTTGGSFDTTHNAGTYDAFITKLNAAGTALVYSTFLGGAGADVGNSLSVDDTGNAYIAGNTASAAFPTTGGAYDTAYNGGGDAFAAKLNSTGTALVYSTYLGGNLNDEAYGNAVDTAGNTFVTGNTTSAAFPTTGGAFDVSHNGSNDIFAAKLNSTGSTLIYSTLLGGGGNDLSYGLDVDDSANAYITGQTASGDFPTTAGAFDNSYNGSNDTFVTKLDPAGSALRYSTYLGGGGNDLGFDVAVDSPANAYVTGQTANTLFPTTAGAYDTTYNSGIDAFVTKLNTDFEPPTTSLETSPTGPNGQNDWYTTTPTISLSRDEPGTTYYQWDSTETAGFDPIFNIFTAPDGEHTIYYFSVDTAGNTETIKNRLIKFDQNEPPVADAGGPYATNEGSGVSLNGSGSSDPNNISGDSIVAFAWDLTNDGVFDDATGATLTVAWSDLRNLGITSTRAPYTVGLRVTDSIGLIDTEIVSLSLTGVAPVVSAGPDRTATEDTSISLDFFAADVGEDTMTWAWDFGDGAGDGAITSPAEDGSRSVAHLFSNPGTFTVALNVTDDDSLTVSDTAKVVVSANNIAGLNTPAGSDTTAVVVSPTPNITLTFTDVIADGSTSATVNPSPIPNPPGGFSFHGNQFDITTTAVFVPPVTVAIQYNEGDVSGNEADLKLFHFENGSWQDVTISVDTVNNIVTGQVNSLSPFILGGPVTPVTGFNENVIILFALAMIGLGIQTVRVSFARSSSTTTYSR